MTSGGNLPITETPGVTQPGSPPGRQRALDLSASQPCAEGGFGEFAAHGRLIHGGVRGQLPEPERGPVQRIVTATAADTPAAADDRTWCAAHAFGFPVERCLQVPVQVRDGG